MIQPNFTTTFTVDQTPEQVFNAAANPRAWWSEEIEGGTAQSGDEFTYRYQDIHRARMRVIEAVPGRKLVWLVLENYFEFTEDKTEWIGTEIIFEISKAGDQTQVRFTHRGLIPDYECYGVCANAWGSYINGSLKSRITIGQGRPNPKESARA